jgi:hypothetical protein
MSGSGASYQEPLLYRQDEAQDKPVQDEVEDDIDADSDDEERDDPNTGHDIRQMQQAINQHHPLYVL